MNWNKARSQDFEIKGGEIITETDRTTLIKVGVYEKWIPNKLLNVKKGKIYSKGWVLEELFGIECIESVKDKEVVFNSKKQVKFLITEQVEQIENVKSYEHQKEALEKCLTGRYNFLFMEAGTGKTKIYIDYANSLYESGLVDSVVFVTPLRIIKTFKNATEKFKLNDEIDIHFINSEKFSTSIEHKSIDDILKKVINKKSLLVVDESHLFKTPETKRTVNLTAFSQVFDYKILGSGTPLTRSIADLYTQFEIMNRDILGFKSYGSFALKHLLLDKWDRVSGYVEIDKITRMIEPFVYQKRLDEAIDLPEKIYNKVYYELEIELYDKYNEIYENLKEEIKKDEASIYEIYGYLEQLSRVCSLSTNKFETFIYKVNELIESGHKLLVFCKYVDETEKIGKKLGKKCLVLNGTRKKVNDIEKEFEENYDVMVATTGMAGTGLNFQFCNNILYFSNDNQLVNRVQSENRIYRIGQEKHSTYYDFVSNGFRDEYILDCLVNKKDLLQALKKEVKNEVK